VTSSRIKQKKVLEDGADKLSRNVRKEQQVLRNAPEERRLENLNSLQEPDPFEVLLCKS
jgi:hypothetical protein